MSKFRIFQVNLDVFLFKGGFPTQAMQIVLNALASNNEKYRTEILERVHPEDFSAKFGNDYRVIFESMTEMIKRGGHVDQDQVRKEIVGWASRAGSEDFVEGCLANFEQALSYKPTSAHVKRAIDILTSPIRLKPIDPPK